jgi:hypothetical protein
MAASLADIAGWWDRGKEQKAAYMIVVCDTFDHDDYPVYVASGEDFWKKHAEHDGQNMQRIMEVYDFSIPWSQQTKGLAMNTPPRSASRTREES